MRGAEKRRGAGFLNQKGGGTRPRLETDSRDRWRTGYVFKTFYVADIEASFFG